MCCSGANDRECKQLRRQRRGRPESSMSGLHPGGSGHGARHHHLVGVPSAVASEFLAPAAANPVPGANKRKRRPAGTPDPGAEVVFPSPKTLMESDRYVCEICNQGFQRDQNLQMHRRRHKVPWKLLKNPSVGTLKRVYVCPEMSCLHHNPAHALGDLVGIKKHYRRKHCTDKQWKCDRCSKRYAVQSDFKAHLKTCGTRGHCCDCGRVFSRVESFIEHQDVCIPLKPSSMQQSFGSVNEREQPVFKFDVTVRNSHDSPSQSSDTTHAVPFAQSEMSERSPDSPKAQQALPTSATYNALPFWLRDRRDHKLELGQPPVNLTVQKSMSYEGLESTFTDGENMPSLQLSLGSLVDSKPSHCASVEKVASDISACHQDWRFLKNSRTSWGDVVTLEITSARPHLGHDLVLSIQNQGKDGSGKDVVKLATESHVHAAATRRTSSKAMELKFQVSKEQSLSSSSEMLVNGNPYGARCNSAFHEDRPGRIHESGMGVATTRVRPDSQSARLEPAAPSIRTVLDLMATPLFSASQSSWICEVDDDTLAAARRSRDQARQASDEAHRELARANCLQREVQKQVQMASAETELANAQCLREHAQAELSFGLFRDQGFPFCHSRKSAI